MAEKLIRIDLGKVKAEILGALPHKPDLDRALKGLGATAMDYWKTLAQKELRSTSRDYIQALTHYERDGKVYVELREGPEGSPLPNMVEQGWPGGDMREWLLQSAKVKQGANGPYLVVPFRHGTPGTSGRNVGRQMPGPIHAAAKKLIPQLTRPGKVSSHSGTTIVHGERLHPGMPMKAAAKKILERKEKPWHSTSIYMGMIRKAQPTATGLQTSGYQTFRTISQHSNEPGKHWVHPGIKPRNLARKVEKHIGKIASAIVRGATK